MRTKKGLRKEEKGDHQKRRTKTLIGFILLFLRPITHAPNISGIIRALENFIICQNYQFMSVKLCPYRPETGLLLIM
ncbi:MAG: hypothetical protein M0Q48_07825 [Verrucomicrobia bacterium]|nr:hypothetical protein [Verrucomicrobiota bacterium]